MNGLAELIHLLPRRHSQTSHDRHHPEPGCRRQRRSIESGPSVSSAIRTDHQYRLWGGRHLANLLTAALPGGPVGEAWLLSDRDDHQSRVTDGPLKGQSIGQLLQQFPKQIMGKLAGRFPDSPLLKFLDVHEMLRSRYIPRKRIRTCCQRRDPEDRSLGRAGSWDTKPYLRGPEDRYN